MSVECLDSGKEFAVVTAGDQDLGVLSHSGLEEGEWAGSELVRLEEGDLVLAGFGMLVCDFGFGE